MERVSASGDGLAAEGQRLIVGTLWMAAPIVVLDVRILYQKKYMMIVTKGTSCAMSDKQ